MTPNPYVIQPVTSDGYFVESRGGRGAQAHSVLRNLQRVDPRPDSISIVGDRRTGKTSMLRYLARLLAGCPDLIVATIDMLGLHPQNQDGFYLMLTRALVWAKVLPKGHPILSYLDFEDLLRDLHDRGKRLMLFIDEFDLVARDPKFDRAFFDNLRSLADNIDLPLTLVVASVASLAEIAHKGVYGSPFFNIFYPKERLVPLSPREAEMLIAYPPGGHGEQSGLTNFATEIIALTGYHPYFLQLACSCAWRLRETNEGELSMDKLRAAFEAQTLDHYQYIWEHCNPVEKNTLHALAKGKPFDASGLKTLMERGYVTAGDPPRLLGTGLANFVSTHCVIAHPTSSEVHPGFSTQPMGEFASAWRKMSHPGMPERRLALIVGVNNYQHREAGEYVLAPLRYAERDAEEMTKLLTQVGFEVIQLIGAQATYNAVKSSFAELAHLTMINTHLSGCFLFHFSGHGQIDPYNNETAYLLLYDTDPRNPSVAGLDMNLLVYNFMPSVRLPNSLVFLDACHAGFAAGVKHVSLASDRLPNVIKQLFNNLHGRMVLAACPGLALARENDALAHGIFTYYLLKHWRDLDGPHLPGCITLGSLIDYVGSAMQQYHPELPGLVYNGAVGGVGSTLILRQI